MSAVARARTSATPLGSVVPQARFTLAQARHCFSDLEGWLMSPQAQSLTLEEVEREQERRGREVQKALLTAHLQNRGDGDVGDALLVTDGNGSRAVHGQRRTHTRVVRTIFGTIKLTRRGYGRPGAESIHPLDADLALPVRRYSYELQRRTVKAVIQGPFDEALERTQESTGERLPKRSVQAFFKEAAVDVDDFYRTRRRPRPSSTGPLVVGSFDGKGIPMVKKHKAKRVVRLGKGQKANKKRMATVAAVFTKDRDLRTPQEVVESLFRTESSEAEPERPGRPKPQHKRVYASLVQGKDAVIGEGNHEMARRDPRGVKEHVVVTDGERALQRRVMKILPQVKLILDFLHVLEYLWKAAYVFHAEGSPEAETWVRERALRILRGQVAQVIKGLRQSATKRGFGGQKAKTIRQVTGYFYRNRTRMRYDQYLAAGLPIASGTVEGACKNLVKDRMERSGMRWTETMAEAMVKLRAVYLSGDFEDYWRYHLQRERQRLYPDGHWRVVNAG